MTTDPRAERIEAERIVRLVAKYTRRIPIAVAVTGIETYTVAIDDTSEKGIRKACEELWRLSQRR